MISSSRVAAMALRQSSRAIVPLAVLSSNGLRLRYFTPGLAHKTQIRTVTSDIAEIKQEIDKDESDNSAETTGVIDVKNQHEVVLYYDHIYFLGASSPAYFNVFLQFLRIRKQTPAQIRDKILKVSAPIPAEAEITQLIPFMRDCGAFAKFQVPPGVEVAEFVQQIRQNVVHNEKAYNSGIFRRVLSLFWSHYPAVYSVKGTPWIEDLRRYPNTKLKVKFEGEPLTEEELYVLFRRYGPLVDIIPGPESAEATLIYRGLRSAIAAKNCITGVSLNKGRTVLHLQYIPIKRVNYITEFVTNHQRIAIPIILALLATLAVLIFDPIRQYFIEVKITKRYSFDTYKDYAVVKTITKPLRVVHNWLSSSYDYIDKKIDSISSPGTASDEKSDDSDVSQALQTASTIWNERSEKSKQIKMWIYENVNTFIIVKGPKGSGKEEFILDHTLLNDEKLRHKILYINCSELAKARSDNDLLKSTANQLGYFPLFTWTNTVSQFVDLGVQGLTGQKSGLSESKETQLKNMFTLTSQAIRSIATRDYQKYHASVTRKNNRLPEGENIEILKEEEYLQQHPECKPIVVIDKFNRKADAALNDFVYPMIAEWSSVLVQNNLAHVIYVTSDVGSIQHLNNALPNQVFKSISLSDASSFSAKLFLMHQLKLEDDHTISGAFEPLGGRMLDLQAFVRRINSGETPPEALEEMVNQASEQVTTFFLCAHKIDDDTNWNAAQVWMLMKLLSKSDSINYSDLNKSPLFKPEEDTVATLTTLEKHDLISLQRDKGILDKISIGRPLFKAAFKQLISDPKISKLYEVDYISTLIKIENEKIKKFEGELISIQKLGDKLGSRVLYLSKKIDASNAKVVEYEGKIAEINLKPASKNFLKLF